MHLPTCISTPFMPFCILRLLMMLSPIWDCATVLYKHNGILPIHNVTINSNNLFVNFRWHSPFALRNRMTIHTSHLAGLWISAAISKSLTQTKSVLPLPNDHGSKVKDQGWQQCCHNKPKKKSLSAYTWCIFTFQTCLIIYFKSCLYFK
jgi:hypothetical protein